ncbi:MAG: hypothetical protein ACREQT_09330 [Candidatus Binataceae bacterium]
MKGRPFLRAVPLVPFAFVSLALLPLAAPDVSLAQAPSSQQTSHLIERLEAAKKADWNAALDPTVSPVRQGTFVNQMNKADRVSKELSHGLAVPRNEIDEALWMPPRHMSPEERARLIQQLEEAKQQDDRNEQQMLKSLAWTRSAAPVDTVTFDQRKLLVDSVIKDLRIGAPVHWSAIKEALVVPGSPH